MLRMSGVAISHVGLVRPDNEDSGFVSPTCMLVADGVGGAAAGEVASATTAYVVSARSLASPDAEPVEALRTAVVLAQEQVAAGVRRDPARSGMATTLTAILTDGETFALAHIGDSRGYVFRDGALSRLTSDHTYVQRLIDEGSVPESAAADHPWRNVVLRCVNGNMDEVGDVHEIALGAGDRILLASDGLTDVVEEPRIAEILGANEDDAGAQTLVDEALALGGRDNITCVLATVIEGLDVAADGVMVGAVRNRFNIVDPAAVRIARSA